MNLENVTNFDQLQQCMKECKLSGNCPGREVRQFYFENEYSAKEYPVIFVCHCPATRTGSENGSIRRTCWQTTDEDLHFKEMRKKIGLEHAYITNSIKCGSIVENKPKPEELSRCIQFIEKEIELVNPRVIVCVGNRSERILHDYLHTNLPILKVPHYSWRRRPNYDSQVELSAYMEIMEYLGGKIHQPKIVIKPEYNKDNPTKKRVTEPERSEMPDKIYEMISNSPIEQYKQKRIQELGASYRSANTSANEWNMCIDLECGNPSISTKNTSGGLCLRMFLECKWTEQDIVHELKNRFPGKSNAGRPKRMYQIFSGGKCRNVTEYHENNVMGLKWDRYKYINERGCQR